MIQLQEDTRVTDPNSAFCAVPTLFLAGSADGISDQQAAIKFFATMGNFDKEFKLFDGLFHMVYEEPEKENVFSLKNMVVLVRKRDQQVYTGTLLNSAFDADRLSVKFAQHALCSRFNNANAEIFGQAAAAYCIKVTARLCATKSMQIDDLRT
ncbi:hypothetical protein ON010_g18716 [Phytophthora cinnamomi]|nr:hypothetical protein ON010_g18716 [Phytophthora cinnamomi]